MYSKLGGKNSHLAVLPKPAFPSQFLTVCLYESVRRGRSLHVSPSRKFMRRNLSIKSMLTTTSCSC